MSAPPVIAIENLTKRYGDVLAIDDLSFKVEPGQVCGLLGPNGAGKTTSLRVLLGLTRADEGFARLFGEPVTAGCSALRRVGATVEEAAFVPHLSGMTNLRLWWEAGGGRLRDAVKRPVKTYSQGMKQRLGFARLLLGRPDVLVLDEPTNGLDPGEIREIRELIRRLADGGATVLLSSHHLPEVEQTCTEVVIMNHGRLIAAGTVSEIISATGAVYVEVDDSVRGRAVLEGLPSVERVVPQGDGLTVELRDGRRSDLVAALVAAGLRVETVMPSQRLEDAFLGLLGEDA